MGLVNAVVPTAELEREAVAWCREMSYLSPLSLRLLKSSFNAFEDGITGVQQLSHDATLLFYMSEEGQEGRNAFKEGRESGTGLREVPAAALRAVSAPAHLGDGRAPADPAGGAGPGAGRQRRRLVRPSPCHPTSSAGAPSSPP